MIFNSKFTHNTLVIVGSLRAGELDTARHLHAHMETYCKVNRHGLELHQAKTREDLERIFGHLVLQANRGIKPILHLEMHGHAELGLELSGGRQHFSWPELVKCLRPVNVLSGGNLVVAIAACHGFRAIMPAGIEGPSPFHMMIAPSVEIEVGTLEFAFRSLYANLFDATKFEEVLNALPQPLEVFHEEEFFTEALVEYFLKLCIGRGGRERRENFVSKGMARHGQNDPEILRALRQYAKSELRPSKEAFDFIVGSYFIDRDRYTVTYEDVMNAVNQRLGASNHSLKADGADAPRL